jgi:acyl dehydratase
LPHPKRPTSPAPSCPSTADWRCDVRVFNGLEELSASLGEHLGYSDWRTITQGHIDTFAEVTGDHQWIHVDRGRAASGPYGSTIAHGYLTLSLVPVLVWEIYRVDGLQMGVNYGANKLRFPAPVPVGARVRAGLELVSITPGIGGHQLTAKVTIEIDGSTKPACVVETISLLVP